MSQSIWFHYPFSSGCPYHRLLLPARYCGDDFGREYGWQFHVGEGLPLGHDVYMLTGLPNDMAVMEVARIKRRGARFVWSVDDDWTCIPDWNPAKPSENQLAVYDMLKLQADWIVTSTPHLARTFNDVKEKVLCAPNLLELSRFPRMPYTEDEDGNRRYNMEIVPPIRVVWSGGLTHKEDMAEVADCVERLLSDYDPQKVIVIFQGMQPPPNILRKYLHRGLFHQPPVPFDSYQSILNSINPHVYLAPLAPVEFNLSKSNLRVMEGWALMAAPVASDWGEYRCIHPGVDGRLVGENDKKEGWWSAVSRLVKDHELRVTMAANGRKRVEEQYNWENPRCRKLWYELFARILETGIPSYEK